MALETAYIAGIFDGEGTVGIYSYKGRVPSPVLAIAGHYKPLLEALQDHYGFGSVFAYGTRSKRKQDWVNYRWQLRSWDEIVKVLEDLLPYLMEKKEQALLMLKARPLAPGRTSTGICPDARHRMVEIEMELKRLKRTG